MGGESCTLGSASLGACNKPSDFNALPAPGVGVAVASAVWVFGGREEWKGGAGVVGGAAWVCRLSGPKL